MRGSLVVLILFNTSTIGNGFIHLSQQRTVMSRQKSIVHYRNPALSKMDVSSNIVGELRSKLIVFSQPNFQEESNDMELVDLEDYEMSDEMLSDIDSYSPGNWEVMKQLMGINIFTYILAALIVIFLSLNTILGPGWLGQTMGIQGTGTFTEISDSLPDNIDLSSPENLL